MSEHKFIRKSGEKCKLFIKGKSTKNINHGDIIYVPNDYRAVCSYVYDDFEGKQKLSNMGSGNGSGAISWSISRYIEDPISFYEGEPIGAGDLTWIDLDTKLHMPILRKLAGDRDINLDIDFQYDCHNHAVIFRTAKLFDKTRHTLQLSPKIDSVYLENKPFTELDPITKKIIDIKNKKYEKLFAIGRVIYCSVRHYGGFCGIKLTIKNILYDDNNKINKVICVDNKTYKHDKVDYEYSDSDGEYDKYYYFCDEDEEDDEDEDENDDEDEEDEEDEKDDEDDEDDEDEKDEKDDEDEEDDKEDYKEDANLNSSKDEFLPQKKSDAFCSEDKEYIFEYNINKKTKMPEWICTNIKEFLKQKATIHISDHLNFK
jgi:hypothetical protein